LQNHYRLCYIVISCISCIDAGCSRFLKKVIQFIGFLLTELCPHENSCDWNRLNKKKRADQTYNDEICIFWTTCIGSSGVFRVECYCCDVRNFDLQLVHMFLLFIKLIFVSAVVLKPISLAMESHSYCVLILFASDFMDT